MKKTILYLMIVSSFIAANLISIHLIIMELSLFRISLFIVTFLMILENLKNNRKISLKFKENQDIIINFYFTWFMYSLFSIGWAKDYYSWIRAIFFIGNGFFGILVLSRYLQKESDFRNVFKIMFYMVILHNVIGWSELLTGSYRFANLARLDRYNQFAYNPSVRVPISMFGNTNDYATFLIIGIFLSYIVLSNSNNKVVKGSCLITIISSILLLFRSNSRANILGLIVGLTIFIYMKYFKKINIKTVLLILMTSILLMANFQRLNNIINLFSNKVMIDFSTGSDLVRLNLIKNGLHFLKETIGFGTGAGNIEYWMETRSIYPIGDIRNIHNWWLEILVGYGILIFIGYIFVYCKKFKSLYYSYKYTNDKFIKNTSLGLLSIMSSFIITSISSSSNIYSEWLWVFWGVIIAYIGYTDKQKNMIITKEKNDLML